MIGAITPAAVTQAQAQAEATAAQAKSGAWGVGAELGSGSNASAFSEGMHAVIFLFALIGFAVFVLWTGNKFGIDRKRE